MSNLTPKESALLAAIAEGMDQPGCGWLHEVTPFQNDHVTAGVLGSLVAKGLAHSHEDTEGPLPCYWVELTPAGEAAAAPAAEPTPAPAPAPYVTAGQAALALAADREAQALKTAQAAHRATPAPESSQAVIDQDCAVPVLGFQPGRFDGPYVAGDGVELWSFGSEAAALRYCQALRREGAEPVALAENAHGQWRPVLPGEALPPEPLAQDGPAPELPTIRPPATPEALRADAAALEAEARQALQALATIPALARSADSIRSMARQLILRAAELRQAAAARVAQAEAQALAVTRGAQDDLALALAWDDLSPEALRRAQDDLALSLG